MQHSIDMRLRDRSSKMVVKLQEPSNSKKRKLAVGENGDGFGVAILSASNALLSLSTLDQKSCVVRMRTLLTEFNQVAQKFMQLAENTVQHNESTQSSALSHESHDIHDQIWHEPIESHEQHEQPGDEDITIAHELKLISGTSNTSKASGVKNSCAKKNIKQKKTVGECKQNTSTPKSKALSRKPSKIHLDTMDNCDNVPVEYYSTTGDLDLDCDKLLTVLKSRTKQTFTALHPNTFELEKFILHHGGMTEPHRGAQVYVEREDGSYYRYYMHCRVRSGEPIAYLTCVECHHARRCLVDERQKNKDNPRYVPYKQPNISHMQYRLGSRFKPPTAHAQQCMPVMKHMPMIWADASVKISAGWMSSSCPVIKSGVGETDHMRKIRIIKEIQRIEAEQREEEGLEDTIDMDDIAEFIDEDELREYDIQIEQVQTQIKHTSDGFVDEHDYHKQIHASNQSNPCAPVVQCHTPIKRKHTTAEDLSAEQRQTFHVPTE